MRAPILQPQPQETQQLVRRSGAVPALGIASDLQAPRIRVPVADTLDPNLAAAPSKAWGGVLEQATRSIGHLFEVQSKAQARLETLGMVSAFATKSASIEEDMRAAGVEPQNWNTEYIKRANGVWQKLQTEGWDAPEINSDGKVVIGPDGNPKVSRMYAKTRDSAALAGFEIQRTIAHQAIQVQQRATKFLADQTEGNFTNLLDREQRNISASPVEQRQQAYNDGKSRIDKFITDNSRYMDLSKAAEKTAAFQVNVAKGSVEQHLIDQMAASKTDADAMAAYMRMLNGEIPDSLKSMFSDLPADSKKKIINDASAFAGQQISLRETAQKNVDRANALELQKAKLAAMDAKDAATFKIHEDAIKNIVMRSPHADLSSVVSFLNNIKKEGFGPSVSDPHVLMRAKADISKGKITSVDEIIEMPGLSVKDREELIAIIQSRQDTNYQRGLTVAKGRLELPTGVIANLDPNNSVHRLLGRVEAEYAAQYAANPTQDAFKLGENIAVRFANESKSAKVENKITAEAALAGYAAKGGANSFEMLAQKYQDLLKKKDFQKAEAYLAEWLPKLSGTYQMGGMLIPDIDVRTGKAKTP